jgi:starch synthase
VQQVLFVASEIYPLIKTGGLADVVHALARALGGLGLEVRCLVPGYPAVVRGLESRSIVAGIPHLFGGPARLLEGNAAGCRVLAIEAAHLYDRPGNPYTGPGHGDWPDNDRRFAALARVGAEIGRGHLISFQPEVVHAHDWQAGLTPAYLALEGGPRPATVQTIHNLAFQGIFPADRLASLGLPAEAFTIDGLEYWGQINFLKAGLVYADRLTTVSPTYAREILKPGAGSGLEGVLAARRSDLFGILNGIDERDWNPASDPYLPAAFDHDRLDQRAASKAALQARFGLARAPDRPLLGAVARLTWQKGLDLLPAASARWLAAGGQMALILSDGDEAQEAVFRGLVKAHPGQVGVSFGTEEARSHLVQAGSDVVIVPSRYEPCGLTQLYALRYGAVPVVSRVGGLADSVIDANGAALDDGVATGIVFGPVTADALADALDRALELYARPERWRALQHRGMTRRFGWESSHAARRYLDLYQRLVDRGSTP